MENILIEKFKEELRIKKFDFISILSKIFPPNIILNDVLEERIFFEFEVNVEHEEEIRMPEKNMSVFFCRCVGVSSILGRKIYCLAGIPALEEMDSFYIKCMVEEYYRMISAWLSVILREMETNGDVDFSYIERIVDIDIEDFLLMVKNVLKRIYQKCLELI